MRSFYRDTVTRWRAPATTNIHGDRDWASAEPVELTRVRVQPTGDGTHRLLGAIDLDLSHTDRISRTDPVTGALEWFEVTENPQRFRSPYGSADHSETPLGGISHG